MKQVCNEVIPFEKSKDEDILISEALNCLEARLRRGLYRPNSSEEVKKYLRLQLADEPDEVFGVIFLDYDFHLLSFEKLFFGTINEAPVYPRKIARRALELNAAKIVIAHNHPSGSCMPSNSDIEVTKEIRIILKIIDIVLIDHIIVSHQESYSCVEHGLL